jgi:hypothetical protein
MIIDAGNELFGVAKVKLHSFVILTFRLLHIATRILIAFAFTLKQTFSILKGQ